MLDNELTANTSPVTDRHGAEEGTRDGKRPRALAAAAKKTTVKKTVTKKSAMPKSSTAEDTAEKATSKKPAAKKTAAKKAVKSTTSEPESASSGGGVKKAAKKATGTKAAAAAPRAKKAAAAADSGTDGPSVPSVVFQAATAADAPEATTRTRSRKRTASVETTAEEAPRQDGTDAESSDDGDGTRRRRRRGGRGRRGRGSSGTADAEAATATGDGDSNAESDTDSDAAEDAPGTTRRRRRRKRGEGGEDDDAGGSTRVREQRTAEADKGSIRIEAKRQRRREGREAGRRRVNVLTEAEFLARRESVQRVMVVRQIEDRTQIAVLEDGIVVEHHVSRDENATMVGNVYLGRVQNVLPSMEAAFVDIGRGRNAVLYAGEVNWDAAGLEGQPRRIEFALKSGDPVLVQVTKDPVGQKGARLTSQISLPGRFVVFVPDGSMTGISRKLPDTERSRLKSVLKRVVPDGAGVIVRTAAEGANEEELERDVARLVAQWEDIEKAKATAKPASLLYGEPNLTIRVVRDIFNEDFTKLVVSGNEASETIEQYLTQVAPDLASRMERWVGTDDVWNEYRIAEQLTKALDRKVWLPSGGSLVIDRTEAMTVVDVNTGRFTGKGGNLEETVTANNLEAAEEVVRQMRLRDIGGIIVVDFIDMVLESNRDKVLRRLVECLGRDRTKHQVAEMTSLGLVQMTRKRVGQGLHEVFTTPCESCNGRGVHVHAEPVSEKKTQTPVVVHKDASQQVARVASALKKSAAPSEDSGADDQEVALSEDSTPSSSEVPAAPVRRRRVATKPAGPTQTSSTESDAGDGQ